MSGLHYDSLQEMPPGLRKLVEAQQEKGADAVFGKNTATEIARMNVTGPKRKYRNTPTERLLENGEVIKFGSKKEAAYYDWLMAELKAGRVRKIRLQHQYLIKPSYIDGETGELFRAVVYKADFVYERLENGEWREHVIDTKGGGRKGTKTKEYIIKRKLLAERGTLIEEA